MEQAAKDSINNAIAALKKALNAKTAVKALEVGVIDALEEINNVTALACAEITDKGPRRKLKVVPKPKLITMPTTRNPNNPDGPGAA